jgi:hypothetical protein
MGMVIWVIGMGLEFACRLGFGFVMAERDIGEVMCGLVWLILN